MEMHSPAMFLPRLGLISCWLILAACATVQEEEVTLRSLDVSSEANLQANVFVKPKTEEEVRQAYYDYVRNTTRNDNARLTALNRLAEIELELSNQLLKQSRDDAQSDVNYSNTINSTIDLLQTSLRDYPNAAGNDRLLYQLAKAFDQIGNQADSLRTLEVLVEKYPKSEYFAEAEFRLAERYFILGDYIAAEDAYTEVLLGANNLIFYEKALFKRGWSRYKQQFYLEAVDDYIAAIEQHGFTQSVLENSAEKDQFDEYLRAVALSFTYLGGAKPLGEYFAEDRGHPFISDIYLAVSDIFVQQQRYSDAASVLEQFASQFPDADRLASIHFEIANIWQQSQFRNKFHEATDRLYQLYNPDSDYWKNPNNTKAQSTYADDLKRYTLLAAADTHSVFQADPSGKRFEAAKNWYERYLVFYAAYARKDNVFLQYAELLDTQPREKAKALGYFELAAWDGEIVLDRNAAYATITITDDLIQENPNNSAVWLNKHLDYVQRYAELYPNDPKASEIIVHGTQLAFTQQQLDRVITLAELLPADAATTDQLLVNTLRGQAYFNTNDFVMAESVYGELLTTPGLSKTAQKESTDRLALAIYKQAELAKENNDYPEATRLFSKISQAAPGSAIGATGLYDAVALAMGSEEWADAIVLINQFNDRYPTHPLQKDIARNLSVAYLNSDQSLKAAKEFEKISRLESDSEIKKAALVQAAELYEKKNDWTSAIRSYRDYANTFAEPFATHMEVMAKLGELYTRVNEPDKAYFWQNKLRLRDQKAPRSQKTERTNFIAASATLNLAKEKHQIFTRRRLVAPLDSNLRKKKQDMQDAVKLYGQSSAFGIADIATEATFSIGQIYQQFSKDLLDSERPPALNADQLEQYNILLEDQAFPFEEKAIEFFETNVARTQSGTYNQWINQSFEALKGLFPFRYGRDVKVEKVVENVY